MTGPENDDRNDGDPKSPPSLGPEFGTGTGHDATVQNPHYDSGQGQSWGGPVYGAPGTGPSWTGQGWSGTGQGYSTGPDYGSQAPGYGSAPYPQGYPQGANYPSSYPGYGAPLGYPPVDPSAPFGRHPVTAEPLSDKSKGMAALLQILLGFFGICGVGRLYIGSTAIGLVQLLGVFVAIIFSFVLIGLPFLIGLWVWAFVDGIVMGVSNVRDGSGRLLRG
jgi:TM2 domain-containing membrane protein YozV